jgi:hypothetical protein
MAACSC